MNNLRRDIHSAFEVIEPPLGGMPERVVQTVLADMRRQRKERMTYPLRISLALVAAVLLVAVGAAAVMTWNSLHGQVSPAGDTYGSQIALLEARPLHLPVFSAQSKCTAAPSNADGSFGAGPLLGESFGAGPLVSSRSSYWTTSWGYYYDDILFADKRITGPVLVRARDLFTSAPVVFVGQFASGPVVGTDVIDGPPVTQRAELLLDANHSKASIDAHGTRHPFVWNFTAAIAKSSSGSSGWQIDGTDFSEVFAIC